MFPMLRPQIVGIDRSNDKAGYDDAVEVSLMMVKAYRNILLDGQFPPSICVTGQDSRHTRGMSLLLTTSRGSMGLYCRTFSVESIVHWPSELRTFLA